MRSSTTILRKLDRWFARPGWAYCYLWYFTPMLRSRLRAEPSDRTDERSHA